MRYGIFHAFSRTSACVHERPSLYDSRGGKKKSVGLPSLPFPLIILVEGIMAVVGLLIYGPRSVGTFFFIIIYFWLHGCSVWGNLHAGCLVAGASVGKCRTDPQPWIHAMLWGFLAYDKYTF